MDNFCRKPCQICATFEFGAVQNLRKSCRCRKMLQKRKRFFWKIGGKQKFWGNFCFETAESDSSKFCYKDLISNTHTLPGFIIHSPDRAEQRQGNAQVGTLIKHSCSLGGLGGGGEATSNSEHPRHEVENVSCLSLQR